MATIMVDCKVATLLLVHIGAERLLGDFLSSAPICLGLVRSPTEIRHGKGCGSAIIRISQSVAMLRSADRVLAGGGGSGPPSILQRVGAGYVTKPRPTGFCFLGLRLPGLGTTRKGGS